MSIKSIVLQKWSGDRTQLNWYGRGMRRIGNLGKNNNLFRLEHIPAVAGAFYALDTHMVIDTIAPHLKNFMGVDLLAILAFVATVGLNLSSQAARKINLIAAPAVPIAPAISAPQAAVPAPIIPPPAPRPSAAFDPTVASVPPARPIAPEIVRERDNKITELEQKLRDEGKVSFDAVRKLNESVAENEKLKAEIAKLKLIQPPAPKPAVPKESEPIEDLSAADIEIIPASKLDELKAAITDQALLDQINKFESEKNFEELLKVLENIKAEGAISETVLAAAQDEVIDKI